MDYSSKQVTTLSLISSLMLLFAIIINQVGSGMFLELTQGFLAGLSFVISCVVIHKFSTREKASE